MFLDLVWKSFSIGYSLRYPNFSLISQEETTTQVANPKKVRRVIALESGPSTSDVNNYIDEKVQIIFYLTFKLDY